MKAMIMAAGLGTRLRPLTQQIAKPMIPVANKPIMEHVIELLARQNVENLFVNIHYQPEAIRNYFGDGREWGVDLTYSYEEELMGTAGGVKRLEPFLKDDTFVVFSSDILTDIDIGRLVSFHKRNNALATVALSISADPHLYGVVETDTGGRITAFHEKPDWLTGTAAVSCGVYVFEPEIFEHIPRDTFYDFGNDVFPKLFESGAPLYAYTHDRYWKDIGRLENYRQGNFDALSGKVPVVLPGHEVAEGIWIGRDTDVHKSAVFVAPLCIGNECVVGPNVRIIGPAVIGHGNIIGAGSIIQETVKVAEGSIGSNLAIIGGVVSHQV